MNGYDQLIPYLVSKELRWSVGAMRGTAAADWQAAVDLRDPTRLGEELAAAGFCAIEVDTEGFDRANDPRSSLSAHLGSPIAESRDGVHVAYALPARPSQSQQARDTLLGPVIVRLQAYAIRVEDGHAKQWVGQQASLQVANLSPDPVPVQLSMSVRAEGADSRELTVQAPSGETLARVRLSGDKAEPTQFHFEAPPGLASIGIRVTGDPVRLTAPARTVTAEITDLRATSASSVRVATQQQQVLDGVLAQ